MKRADKVVVVDDDLMSLKTVRRVLEKAGIEGEYFRASRKPSPGMDGLECLRRIRAQEGGLCRDAKAVCLTANVGEEMETLCREAGFDGYLPKPVKGRQLEEELARLMLPGNGDSLPERY